MFKQNILAEKTILITGGGSGLGLSMARRFAQLGANIAICGRTQSRLDRAKKELDQIGKKVFTYSVDVRDYDRLGEMIEKIVAHFGALDSLLNNAAGNFLSPAEDISPNGFKTIIDIVLQGSFNCTHHFGNYLIRGKKHGSILNIVTTYASLGSAFVLPSACAKAGVLTMTKSLAAEWAVYGIRVNAIAPGAFPTEGAWSRLMPDPKMEEMYLKKIPAGRYGEHIELANLATFLLSDLAPFITGECVTIDGGESLQGGQFNFLTQLIPRNLLRQMAKAMRKTQNE
ncbi:MAG TPA: SDR family oxidoreductase [Bacteroidetes bacterium]|nr:SDR family oxidoreductase [Bacteroidota bacterium]